MKVFRKLGTAPLPRKRAKKIGELLGLDTSSVYRLRRRFLQIPMASALILHGPGPRPGELRLDATVENIVSDVLTDWLPRQRYLEHPLTELIAEIRKRCTWADVDPPSRPTVSRRLAAHLQTQPGSRAKRRVTGSTTNSGRVDPFEEAV